IRGHLDQGLTLAEIPHTLGIGRHPPALHNERAPVGAVQRRTVRVPRQSRLADQGEPHASNSPSLAPATNASHSAGVNTSTGPCGSLLSRTAIRSPTNAASTQLSQFGPLLELLRHTAPPRLILVTSSPRVVRRGTVPRRQPAAQPPAGPSPRAAPTTRH